MPSVIDATLQQGRDYPGKHKDEGRRRKNDAGQNRKKMRQNHLMLTNRARAAATSYLKAEPASSAARAARRARCNGNPLNRWPIGAAFYLRQLRILVYFLIVELIAAKQVVDISSPRSARELEAESERQKRHEQEFDGGSQGIFLPCIGQ